MDNIPVKISHDPEMVNPAESLEIIFYAPISQLQSHWRIPLTSMLFYKLISRIESTLRKIFRSSTRGRVIPLSLLVSLNILC